MCKMCHQDNVVREKVKHVVVKDVPFTSYHEQTGAWGATFLLVFQVTILKIVIFQNNCCKFK